MQNEAIEPQGTRSAAPLTAHLRVHARNRSIREALAELRRKLETLSLSEEELGTVELVLAEVMNNVAEHAYAWRRDGEMLVTMRHMPGGLVFTVTDDGRAMPRGTLPFGQVADPAIPKHETREGGYGWLLIRELAHDVSYVRHAGHNQLSFRLGVAKALTRTTA